MKRIVCAGVDFKQNVNLLPSPYTAKSMAVYELGKNSTFCLQSTLKHNFLPMKFCTLVFKYIFSHIVKRTYAYAPQIYFYRLIS